MQIEIDFDVFKALTVRRQSEDVTYNDVLRDLLGLDPKSRAAALTGFTSIDRPQGALRSYVGYSHRGLELPEGTQLRATYKGRTYSAEIREGRWIDERGVEHNSPSGAAHAVTGTNVNGLRFWQARRPNDLEWRKLDALPRAALG